MRLLAPLVLCAFAFAAEPLTNETIARMAATKVPEQTILETIRNAPDVRFRFTPGDTDWLVENGVSETVLKAMAARSSRVAEPAVDPATQPPVAAPVVQPPARPRRERPDHWGMTPGMPEVAIGGGVGMLLSDLGEIPDVVTGVASLDGGIGINRYVAGIGSITRHSRGGITGCIDGDCIRAGSASLTEFLAGIRLSASNTSRVTPFFTGLLGAARARADVRTNDRDIIYGSAWNPAGALGAGFEINATRNVGVRTEARFLRTIDAG